MRKSIRYLFYIITFVFIIILKPYSLLPGKIDLESSAQTIQERNLPPGLGEKIFYKIRFNGIYSGRIECEYLGRQKQDNKLVDAIMLSSDVKILKFLEIESKEKLFIDSQTHLPLKIEREVIFLGKQEKILEEYNQKESRVKITKLEAPRSKEEILNLQGPIQNIIALLYFFPKDKELQLGETFSFVLPTQKINIKVVALKLLDTSKSQHEVYVLKGEPRKFTVWLEKERRLPLKIEFPVILGKITISLTESREEGQ